MRHIYLNKFLKKIEGRIFFSDKFHRWTNNKKVLKKTEIIPLSWIKIHFKTYPRLDKVIFNQTNLLMSKIGKIINTRRSVRKFSGASISKNELYYLLFTSCGLTVKNKNIDYSRRPYPSAGARYPLEVYPIILNCKDIKKGLYHYNVKENLLELLLEEDLRNWIVGITNGEKWIKNASIVFVVTGVLDRSRIKYGDRGYRYALIEAGHVGQNICLLATELGLGTCPLGGYIDTEVNKLLDIDLQKEVALYLIAVGKV